MREEKVGGRKGFYFCGHDYKTGHSEKRQGRVNSSLMNKMLLPEQRAEEQNKSVIKFNEQSSTTMLSYKEGGRRSKIIAPHSFSTLPFANCHLFHSAKPKHNFHGGIYSPFTAVSSFDSGLPPQAEHFGYGSRPMRRNTPFNVGYAWITSVASDC